MIFWAGAKLFRTEEKVLGNLIYHVGEARERRGAGRGGGKEGEREEEEERREEKVVRKWEGRREGARGLGDLCMARLMVSQLLLSRRNGTRAE